MSLRFRLVDVFGTAAFTGNPLPVFHEADRLSSEEMQTIARWFNFSETTFLLRPTDPGADYRARIFTPAHELPFAGHPTLGGGHAWLEGGGNPKRNDVIVQECGAGLVQLRRDNDRLSFAAPSVVRSGKPTKAELSEVLNVLRMGASEIVDSYWVDNGPGWIAVLLKSAEAVLSIDPVRHYPRRIDIGVVGPHPAGSDAAFELRAIYFDERGTLIEDPVPGSLNASVAEWLFATGRATADYVAAQGACLGRTGRIHISRDEEGHVWTGGKTLTLFEGETVF
jgi:PhzF family phenazine biosynthesis protein